MQEEPNMIVYAVPCNKSIIVDAEKAEEFLNIKRDEELWKMHKERFEKFKHIVTDNTKVGD